MTLNQSSRLFRAAKLLVLVLILSLNVYAQSGEPLTGKVSYITSQNVYVEFSTTIGIQTGDTLFTKSGAIYKALMTVQFVSSRSAAGSLISGMTAKVGDPVTAFVTTHEIAGGVTVAGDTLILQDTVTATTPTQTEKPAETPRSTKLRGRVSVQSSSTFLNGGTEDDLQRWRYTFLLKADDAFVQGLTLSTYMNFAYNTRDWAKIKEAPLNRVYLYDLHASYIIKETGQITLGRKINVRMANLGVMDGLQFESSSEGMIYGIFAGSRPSVTGYGIDMKLFQTGAYISRTDSFASGPMENSIAFANQTNNFVTDRRFIYLQHSSYFLPASTVFLSSEFDLFKNVPGQSGGIPELSSIYFLVRTKFSKEISTTLSYDARRNVVYYETYKNFIDSMFINEMRQGTRLSIHYRILPRLNANFSGGYRFRKGDIKASSNLSAYIGWSGIPVIFGSAGYSYTRVNSSYTQADNHSITYRNDIGDAFSYSAGYRLLSYNYVGRSNAVKQNIITADFDWRFTKDMYVSLSLEEAYMNSSTSGRVYLDLTKRF